MLCLDENSLTTKCENSVEYFDSSNQRLLASLQQSAPGLFQLSEEGAIINSTSTNGTPRSELDEAASEHATDNEEVAQPSVYGYNDPAFV